MARSPDRESRWLHRARERVHSDPPQHEDERTNNERGDPNGMSWMITSLLLIAETTSLGVLGLAQAVRNVGLIPGLFLINILYPLLWYTGLVVYHFKIKNFHIGSFADGLALILGRWSYCIGTLLMVLYLLFVMAAHIVGFSLMWSTIVPNGVCNIIWKVLASLLYLAATAKRSLNAGKISYFASCISIFVAAFIALFGVGFSPPSHTRWSLVAPAGTTSLATGAEAVSYIIVASMAHIAYPTIIGEMKKPREFPKALALQQVVTLTFANIVAIAFYLMDGQAIDSPALDSVPSTTGKIAWGMAGPSILICGVIAAMIAAKVLYQSLWGDRINEVRQEKSKRAIGSWLGITFLLTITAFVLACGVPMFNHLFSLMGSLFGTAFAMIFPAIFWFRMNWVRTRISEHQPPVERRREDSQREAESAQKESCANFHGITTTSTMSEQTDDASTQIAPLEAQPRGSIVQLVCEFASTVRSKPLWSALNFIILFSGLTMCGLGTYGAVIGILDASIDQPAFAC